MTNNGCLRCGSTSAESLNTHSFCPNCNFGSEADSGDDGAIIPQWVVEHLKFSPAELKEIAEINSGKYGPGYRGVVKIPKENLSKEETRPGLRRLRWSKRPKSAQTASEKRRHAVRAATWRRSSPSPVALSF
jgi:hypothetical protein